MAKQNTALKAEHTACENPGAPQVVSAGAGARALDRVIHERLRLGIVSALSVNESLTFTELKKISPPPMAT